MCVIINMVMFFTIDLIFYSNNKFYEYTFNILFRIISNVINITINNFIYVKYE